jgi:hypothetical protein
VIIRSHPKPSTDDLKNAPGFKYDRQRKIQTGHSGAWPSGSGVTTEFVVSNTAAGLQ